MVYMNVRVHHGGAFGYEEGVFKYLKGQSTIIEDIDSDRWSLFEAYEELRQFGYLQANIVALWYKDPSFDYLETSLKMLKGDAEAIEMCNIAGLRGLVELYVVHDVGDAEPFPEVGYVDVGGVAEEGTDDGLGLVVFEGHGAEAAGASAEPNKATKGGDVGDEFQVDGSESNNEDSEDPEYMPSDEEGDSVGEVHFANSDEDFEGDNGFDDGNSVPEEVTACKEKGKGINQLSDEDRVDSDEDWRPFWSAASKYEVMCGLDKFVVDLAASECSYRRWQMSGLPCPHAISCITFKGLDLESFVDDHYKKDAYLRCYQEVIHPLNGPNLWERSQYDDVMPPSYRKPSHRPVKKRKRGPGDDDNRSQKSSAATSSTSKKPSHSQPIQRKRPFSVIQTGAPHIPMQKLKLMAKLPPSAWGNL
ncbi:hypothetical protein Ahy_A03g014490 [Arachis hypogaea]|uniref:Zinc finger PMZ-type domain-containing protein n=1 Tax=Arachis hypogaea TaxID=3818 RepID=A0A445DXT9_ARAHY|nr:hypothetical protein Ahy_A03g014490 [Arachis hypogaea]